MRSEFARSGQAYSPDHRQRELHATVRGFGESEQKFANAVNWPVAERLLTPLSSGPS